MFIQQSSRTHCDISKLSKTRRNYSGAGENYSDASYPSNSLISYPIKEAFVTKKRSCFLMKNWLPFWFILPICVLVLPPCLHRSPFRKSSLRVLSLFLFSPISVVFQHYKSEASRDHPMSAGVIYGISSRLLQVIILYSFSVKTVRF